MRAFLGAHAGDWMRVPAQCRKDIGSSNSASGASLLSTPSGVAGSAASTAAGFGSWEAAKTGAGDGVTLAWGLAAAGVSAATRSSSALPGVGFLARA